jgi:MoxR-like ATPase
MALRIQDAFQGRIWPETHRVLYGCEESLRDVSTTLLAGGHCLGIGLSGVGKTLMFQVLGEELNCGFNCITLTSDMLPAQIVGSEVFNPKSRELEKRPAFFKPHIGIYLVDELTRGPGRLQSGLLEVMNDRCFRIGGEAFFIEPPFFVMSAYNPVDNNGTYPLVGALVDRCYMRTYFKYPTTDQMTDLGMDKGHQTGTPIKAAGIKQVTTREEVVAWQKFVREEVRTDRSVVEYITRLVEATRPENLILGSPGEVYKKYMPVKWRREKIIRAGASNRTVYMMAICAKANAALEGRTQVTDGDVKAIAPSCLSHKIVFDPSLEMSKPFGFDRQVVAELLDRVPTSSDE